MHVECFQMLIYVLRILVGDHG